MRRKILALISVGILSFSLVGCSNKENTETGELKNEELPVEDTTSGNIEEEKNIFDEEVVILDGDIKVTVQGKSKITPGDSVGYIYKVSNMSDEDIEFYVKDVEVDNVVSKTDLEESTKKSLQSLTDFSTQMTFTDITSLEDLKNTTGTFCIKISEGVDEYEFELE